VKPIVLVDTGPLVALLNKRDHYHRWVREQMPLLRPPMHTCEAVLAEAFHLLRNLPKARTAILEMIRDGALLLPFLLREHTQRVLDLLQRYASVPMSLTDACLVRMSELESDCVVFTLDSDFHIYRRHKQEKIPLVIPPQR
jgi:predicted nucleic acid-binding protein